MNKNYQIIDDGILKKVKVPLSYNCEFFLYSLYRRLICCKAGKHRFMFVDEDDRDLCSFESGYYYCSDCGEKASTLEIKEYYISGSDVWGTEEYNDLMMERVVIKGACKLSQNDSTEDR